MLLGKCSRGQESLEAVLAPTAPHHLFKRMVLVAFALGLFRIPLMPILAARDLRNHCTQEHKWAHPTRYLGCMWHDGESCAGWLQRVHGRSQHKQLVYAILASLAHAGATPPGRGCAQRVQDVASCGCMAEAHRGTLPCILGWHA